MAGRLMFVCLAFLLLCAALAAGPVGCSREQVDPRTGCDLMAPLPLTPEGGIAEPPQVPAEVAPEECDEER